MDYQKVYIALISHRKTNPIPKSGSVYTESHHIIPKCAGGDNSPENLVRLTAREHFISHKLLAKIYPLNGGVQMALASFLMRRNEKGTVRTSRDFETLKVKSAEQCSIRMKLFYSDEKNLNAMTGRLKAFHSDPVNKELMRNNVYNNELTRAKISSAAREQWQSEEHRNLISKKNSEAGKKVWEDESYAERHFEGRKKFFENNKMPWQRPRGIPTKKYWALAMLLWNMSKYSGHPEPIGAKSFSIQFDEGLRVNIYHRMLKMFSEGWIPNQDQVWLEEFGDYNW